MSVQREVLIRDGDGFEITANFAVRHRRETEDPVAVALLDLSDDWSSYSISAMSNFTQLAGVQGSVFHHQIANGVVEELKKISIGWGDRRVGESNEIRFFIHGDDIQVASDLITESQGFARAVVALQRSTISALLAELDFFLQRLLIIIKDELPASFWDTQEKYTVAEIQAHGGIDGLRENLLAKKIEDKLRGSHAATFRWLIDAVELKQDASKLMKNSVFLDFVEVCQVRHLLTHNGGVVNKRYVEECIRAGWKVDDLPYKEGDRLDISPAYVKRAIGRVYLTGLFFLHFIIQGRGSMEKVDSLRSLLNIAHDFLRAGHTKMCRRLCEFGLFGQKSMDRDLELRYAINYALSALHDPALSTEEQLRRASGILDKFDWSVRDPIFDLAYACVMREFNDLTSKARAAQSAGLDRASVLRFAVFKEARSKPEFIDCFPRPPIVLGMQEVQQA